MASFSCGHPFLAPQDHTSSESHDDDDTPPQHQHQHLHLPLLRRLTSHDTALETAGAVWHAGYTLSVHLTQRLAELVRGRHVLEIGSGTGIVGLTCAALGAASVTLTDLAGQVAHLRANIDTMRPLWAPTCPSVVAAALPFGDAPPRPFDVLLGADIGYDPSLHAPIAATVAAFFHAEEDDDGGGAGKPSDGGGEGEGGAGRARRVALLAEEVRWGDIYRWYCEDLHAASAAATAGNGAPWALAWRERIDGQAADVDVPQHHDAIELTAWTAQGRDPRPLQTHE
jgi:hypothetical protein